MPQISMNSPVGAITIFEFDDQIVAVDWGFVEDIEPSPVLSDAKAQLNAYFDGKLDAFNLPLAPDGTDFHKAVWDAMCKIPRGKKPRLIRIWQLPPGHQQPIKRSAQPAGLIRSRSSFRVTGFWQAAANRVAIRATVDLKPNARF